LALTNLEPSAMNYLQYKYNCNKKFYASREMTRQKETKIPRIVFRRKSAREARKLSNKSSFRG